MDVAFSSPACEYITDLKKIATLAQKNSAADFAFVRFLKTSAPSDIDTIVKEISTEVARGIDCTACANCCKALVVAPDYRDISDLAAGLDMTTIDFKKKYMRRDSEGDMVMKQKPCPFLKSSRCSVYSQRPQLCRKYPYLDQGHFIDTLNRVLRNLHVCPIVFNTFELLKIKFSTYSNS